MKVTEQADNLGGVHNQEPGSLHPEAASPVEDADQSRTSTARIRSQAPRKTISTSVMVSLPGPLPERQPHGTASATIVSARPITCQ
jgi:hypothetical protein